MKEPNMSGKKRESHLKTVEPLGQWYFIFYHLQINVGYDSTTLN